MNNFDWQWWRYFLALQQNGSVNKAASELGISQPTLGRHLLAMETKLGQSLFDRSTQGLSITQFGANLLEECLQMQASAERLQRISKGAEQQLSGRIRLSANELLALFYLPKILPAFLDTYPELSVEIDVSNRASNLDKRDSDIAIRMFRPTQLDLVTRHLMDVPLGFYAHPSYLEKYGTPRTWEDFNNYRVLGYDRDRQFEEGGQVMGWEIHNENFKFRTDYMPLHLAMAKEGGGIVATHQILGEQTGLTLLDFGITLPKLPIFLTCHRDVQHNKQIRVLMDYLAEYLPTAL
jgi:DNA-binding transcriptional LysR family regulator